ncbi:MAG: hypothetical protein ING12_15375 [Roseomonas sp.]|nr:hypothetical protein [Roseomonas sp.]
MLGSALYYPHIDIADQNWLRTAVLFWDEIKTIAPRAVKSPFQTEDTNVLWKEGYLEPLRCDLHPDLLDTLGKRVVSLMDLDQFLGGNRHTDPNVAALIHAEKLGREIRDGFRDAHIHPEKLSPELRALVMVAGLARMHPDKLPLHLRLLIGEMSYGWIHPEKISPRLQRELGRRTRISDRDGEWLLVDGRFATIYMSALAALLAKETDLAALTNEDSSLGVNLHGLLEDVKAHTASDKKGALVSFMMESIKIDPTTKIDRLLAFRRARQNQLAELSAQFEDLSSKISSCESGRELEDQARQVYTTRIRPKLDALKEELSDNAIQSVWEGVQRAVTISVPAGGALSYFSGLAGTTLLAAGAAIAITDIAVKTHLARNRIRRASPYTYLLDVERKFGF